MPKDLPVLRKPGISALLLFIFFTPALYAADRQWYRSNTAGMALEQSLSRAAALRNEYALSIYEGTPEDIPEFLASYYGQSAPFIEIRALYENGEEKRTQWIFRDENNIIRILATSRFMEFYNDAALITEERQFLSSGEESSIRFFYNKGTLVRVENSLITKTAGEADQVRDIYTDYYRYSRGESLRAIERIYHESGGVSAEPVRHNFKRHFSAEETEDVFIKPSIMHSSEFLEDVFTSSAFNVLYAVDEKGRILTETRKNEEEKILGKITNTWSGDRLVSIEWEGEDAKDKRRVEYEYSSQGDRILEQNFRNDTLERSVRRDGDKETEELYMNGVVILRAVWEDGRKISEERVRERR
jgi:hypothetical protein